MNISPLSPRQENPSQIPSNEGTTWRNHWVVKKLSGALKRIASLIGRLCCCLPAEPIPPLPVNNNRNRGERPYVPLNSYPAPFRADDPPPQPNVSTLRPLFFDELPLPVAETIIEKPCINPPGDGNCLPAAILIGAAKKGYNIPDLDLSFFDRQQVTSQLKVHPNTDYIELSPQFTAAIQTLRTLMANRLRKELELRGEEEPAEDEFFSLISLNIEDSNAYIQEEINKIETELKELPSALEFQEEQKRALEEMIKQREGEAETYRLVIETEPNSENNIHMLQELENVLIDLAKQQDTLIQAETTLNNRYDQQMLQLEQWKSLLIPPEWPLRQRIDTYINHLETLNFQPDIVAIRAFSAATGIDLNIYEMNNQSKITQTQRIGTGSDQVIDLLLCNNHYQCFNTIDEESNCERRVKAADIQLIAIPSSSEQLPLEQPV